MKPLPAALFVLCLAAPPLFAQREPEKAPRPEPARPAPPAPPRPEKDPARPAGVDAFWLWFAGTKDIPGAYAEPELTCVESHFLINAAPRERFLKRRINGKEGHLFAHSFIIDVNSHPDLCLHKGAPSRPGNQPQPQYVGNEKIPDESVLPTPSSEVAGWFATADASKAAGAAFEDYLAAADPDGKPSKRKKRAATTLEKMRDARKTFWESSMKLALADADSRIKACARVDLRASCVDAIQGKSLDDIYAAARRKLD